MNKPTLAEIYKEIEARAPWYQSIDFPEYGISTTDNPQHAMLDAAWDNKTEGLSLEEAARLRPKPKYEEFKAFLPDVNGLEVLEIGSNCGFFSFEFAKMGAKSIVGLDVADKWLSNARWAKEVLGFDNVNFYNCDFMRFESVEKIDLGLLSHVDKEIPLPNGVFDLVFMSTVLDHLFFPLLSIYKMCRISREWVVIDVPILRQESMQNEAKASLGIAADGSHHGFTFSTDFIRNYLVRIGIPNGDITIHKYRDDSSACIKINVKNMNKHLYGA
ncbi:methyltransferase domain-containing protein [Polynucleobacter paneuropaeus]|nr:methyltransferase domain-containing protein [Polynucleobacter paneuropaeus]MBT8530965.1 methyltransferase domain-containing protein [Polynucleobacter paneuropaeus]MBT8602478.1 methyltransferase domain-containing protein [Polynucleobacter paneuropaeus]MBT8624431.1 methyltransferase domain-containing protein [Polynucleobacter paneuropaeus]MBT8628684.1 methyltransferase domain-containing protein [Polynucleobacter paneuropaeus]